MLRGSGGMLQGDGGMLQGGVFIPVAAFLLSFIVLRVLLSDGLRRRMLDRPNERSLHERPVPRTGGLAIMAGAGLALPLLQPRFTAFIPLVAVLVGTSVLDDLRGLPAWIRLIVHLCVAGAFCLDSLQTVPPVAVVAAILAIAWMTNLYNFMDGSDGLAGGMAVIGFGAYALGAAAHGDAGLALLCGSVAASAAAFLLFNFAPARIFMGDAGSVPLGFLAAALGALGWAEGAWAAWFPVLVFSPFIVDATITLLRRMARREAVWQAHREHYYQRLVLLGLGHRGTALAEYALMLAAAGCALWLRNEAGSAPASVMLLAWGLGYAGLAFAVDRRWRSFHAARGASPPREPPEA